MLGSNHGCWKGKPKLKSLNNIEEIQQNNEDLSEILERIYKDYRASPVAQTVKNLPANAGDTGLIPGSGRSPGERSGNPLQYSCLENPMDREAWWATVHGVTKESDSIEWLTLSLSVYGPSELFPGKMNPLSGSGPNTPRHLFKCSLELMWQPTSSLNAISSFPKIFRCCQLFAPIQMPMTVTGGLLSSLISTEKIWLWHPTDLDSHPASPLTTCVIQGKLLNWCGLHFLICRMGIITSTW